ncbi:hypothetical protein BG011_003209 [Mortierella polycephala]|uniref:Uncharacterized protein n=1 Tax=Mortierella polycephala TaxID=41804 RepID=A0A9P6Q472_9FUNG|nr:hypothetical protein BG011_003209 [Mortierella polycephala]
MAVPRAPPQDASALANRPPPKSILKKRPSDMNVDASAGGFVASAAIAGAGPGPNHSNNGKNGSKTTGGAAVNATRDMEVHEPTPISGVGSRRPSALESEDIHPMATPDMDPEEIKLLTPPTDHRARLTTHSPTPSHPQQQGLGTLSSTSSSLALKNTRKSGGGIGKAIGASVQMPVGGAGSPQKRNNDGSTSNTTMDMNKKRDPNQQQQHDSYNSSAGAAIPPDFTPGVQSNLHKDRGGERPQGDVGGQDITQDEMLTQQMFSLSSRAQDLVSQYYGLDDVGGSLQAPGATAVTAAAAGSGETRGPRQRRINFLDMIEIIPAHRKSDYNRSSDKHATFRVLTPDLKSEIRDELNTYKMREMAVHVESMANTAFH